jgi:hypothetical protein
VIYPDEKPPSAEISDSNSDDLNPVFKAIIARGLKLGSALRKEMTLRAR